jgi:hypothetical protein
MRLEQYLVQACILTGALAEGLGKAGRREEALATITVAIEQGELNGEPYDMPELLRIKGELLAAGAQSGHSEAEQYLRRSLELAHRQSAVGWDCAPLPRWRACWQMTAAARTHWQSWIQSIRNSAKGLRRLTSALPQIC